MGSPFAARLGEVGADVTVVDVDAHRIGVLNRDGITLLDDQDERIDPVRAVPVADVAAPVDLIIMFTKGMHRAAVTATLADIVRLMEMHSR